MLGESVDTTRVWTAEPAGAAAVVVDSRRVHNRRDGRVHRRVRGRRGQFRRVARGWRLSDVWLAAFAVVMLAAGVGGVSAGCAERAERPATPSVPHSSGTGYPSAAVASPAVSAGRTASSAVAAYYADCAAVRRAGKAPLRRGEPGYRAGLDRDGDGIACDTGR